MISNSKVTFVEAVEIIWEVPLSLQKRISGGTGAIQPSACYEGRDGEL